ncbi:MAG: AzlC family ABC transporter permease [Bacillota bacterium]|nr:AzlC family ABC transporter permease [Bacillota bacterium]
MVRRAFSAAFVTTIPVMLGYLSIGIAFGLMIQSIGYDFLWAAMMSIVIYAGSMQYVAVDLLHRGAGYIEVAIMTFLVQARHIVYGLSLIEKFKKVGRKKFYMIFALTDETYALLSSAKAPEGINEQIYYFAIALLDHCYWITGGVIGALAGSLINFNIKGVDFAMTALFIVIATEQWLTSKSHASAFIGGGCAAAALILFGANNMLIPAMIAMTVILLSFSKKLDVLYALEPAKEKED